LASITHNEEKNLGPCLEIAKGLVSEIVTVDSGSTDRTTQFAADYRAQVYQNPWPGHIAQKNIMDAYFENHGSETCMAGRMAGIDHCSRFTVNLFYKVCVYL